MTVEELYARARVKEQQSREYWFALLKDMQDFLRDAPEEEKKKMHMIGPYEMVCMICEGYEFEDQQTEKKIRRTNSHL